MLHSWRIIPGSHHTDQLPLQARLCEQEAATAEQFECAQKLQEAVETGKGKLAESAAFMQKLQDEQHKAKEQISEYAAQVHTLHIQRYLRSQSTTNGHPLLPPLQLSLLANTVIATHIAVVPACVVALCRRLC